MARAPKKKVLRPVHPNAGIRAEYDRRLMKLIDEMHKSITYWVEAAYKKNEPEMAMDALPSNELQSAVSKLVRRWKRNFNRGADALAEWFAQSVSNRSDAALKKILKDAGISVEFTMTRAQRDVLNATINENVSLIKSIPNQYLSAVEGAVMRSVSAGRDLGALSKELQSSFGVTRRRAALISRDQNNKATAMLNRARRVELGINKAIWIHSSAGKVPRPSHVKAGRERAEFDVSQGWYDPHEKKYIQPGELINCRCVSRPVIAGFS